MLPLMVFLPLAAGFVILFLPNRISPLSKVLTLIISVVTFALSIGMFAHGELAYAWPLFQIETLDLDLLLAEVSSA